MEFKAGYDAYHSDMPWSEDATDLWKEGYVYADTQFNDNERRVLYLELLNCFTTTPGRDEELLKVIRDDEYVNPVTNQKHSLKNRLFTVATALTSGSTELLPELKAQFDCYLHDDNDPENKEFFLKRLDEKVKKAKVLGSINWKDIIGNLSKDGDK